MLKMLEQYNRIFLSGVHFVQSFVTEETFQGLLHQCCILVKRSLQAVGVSSLALRAVRKESFLNGRDHIVHDTLGEMTLRALFLTAREE